MTNHIQLNTCNKILITLLTETVYKVTSQESLCPKRLLLQGGIDGRLLNNTSRVTKM